MSRGQRLAIGVERDSFVSMDGDAPRRGGPGRQWRIAGRRYSDLGFAGIARGHKGRDAIPGLAGTAAGIR